MSLLEITERAMFDEERPSEGGYGGSMNFPLEIRLKKIKNGYLLYEIQRPGKSEIYCSDINDLKIQACNLIDGFFHEDVINQGESL